MKRLNVILVLLASSALLFASLDTPCEKSTPPAMSLPDAYRQALIILGSDTNQYHCVSATIPEVVPEVVTLPITLPAWLFTFCSTNTPPKESLVYIEMNTKHEFYIAK
jgi:hypothetical protein